VARSSERRRLRLNGYHKRKKALVTIALTSVDDPSLYGVARLDGSRIVEFVEKPKKEDAPSNFINSGFILLNQKIMR